MEKYQLLTEIKNILIKNKLTLSSAESCTGGLISSYFPLKQSLEAELLQLNPQEAYLALLQLP